MSEADEVDHDQQIAARPSSRIDQPPDFEPPANPEWDMDWWELLWLRIVRWWKS